MTVYDENLQEVMGEMSLSKVEKQTFTRIRVEVIDQVVEIMKEDRDFSEMFKKIHYGGSQYEKLKTGRKQECDLNIVFRTPQDIRITKREDEKPHFMRLETSDPSFRRIQRTKNILNPVDAFQVLQRAADRALAKLENNVVLDDGLTVEVTRSINNPYTLNISPTWGGICTDRMEIDMVPAFEIPTCILPDKIRIRVLQVQERVGIVEEKCLAVALPVVNKELFQIDFPQMARKMMAGKPSLKAAIRLLKYERDQKGGPFAKIWSYALKNAGLWEVYKFPGESYWAPCNMENRYFGIRDALADYLEDDKLPDLFFPDLNMMKRICSIKVKTDTGKYLRRTNPDNIEKIYPCEENKCRKTFSTVNGSLDHFKSVHGKDGKERSTSGRKKNAKVRFQVDDKKREGRREIMDREENEERVLQCPLNICERKFFNNHGAAQHAVDSHRIEADRRKVWPKYLRSEGLIPCGFCSCSGGKVRGFGDKTAYAQHCSAMMH